MELNRLIAEWCHRHQMPCVDRFQSTSEGPSFFLAPHFSSDGLHLNAVGSMKFAQLMWNELFADRFGPCPL